MKKSKIGILMALLLFLCGCGNENNVAGKTDAGYENAATEESDAGDEDTVVEETDADDESTDVAKSEENYESTVEEYDSVIPIDLPERGLQGATNRIHFYNQKLYVDYRLEADGNRNGDDSSTNIRLVLEEQNGELVVADTIPLPGTWDGETKGFDKYIVSGVGEYYDTELWIYDLESGSVDTIEVSDGEEIENWDIKGGTLYYCVLNSDKGSSEQTGFAIYARDLADKTESMVYSNEQIEWVAFMSVNESAEIGLIYEKVGSDDHHLGIVSNGSLEEIDMQNVEVWQQNKIQHYVFQLLDDKMVLCTEDLSHNIPMEYRETCYEVYRDGSWNYIPCNRYSKEVLGYVYAYFDLGDYYAACWTKRSWEEDGGRVILCTADGKLCEEANTFTGDYTYFLCFEEEVYILSVSGNEVDNIMFEMKGIAIEN